MKIEIEWRNDLLWERRRVGYPGHEKVLFLGEDLELFTWMRSGRITHI